MAHGSNHNSKHSCPCHSEHHHSAHHHRQHKRKPSEKAPKDVAAKLKDAKGKPEGEPKAKAPVERPWSSWIAGDNGDYFYRARQKPGGKDPPAQ